MSEVSFENVAKVMGVIYAFETGEKCNCLFTSVFFVFANISNENELFVSKVGFTIFVEVMGFHMCFRMVKSAIVCACLCFFLCLSWLFQNCLKNEVPHYFLSQKLKRLNISSRQKEAPHYFFRKKLSASLFLQKKKRCLIIS